MAGFEPGYLRYPAIHGDTLALVCEDDLWLASAAGGRAWQPTAGVGEVGNARFSPDGQWLAFVGREEGAPEVYVMPAAGGTARRLTFQGTGCTLAGWSPDGKDILYSSAAGRPFRRDGWLYAVSPAGGLPRRLPIGPATAIDHGPNGEEA